MDLDSSGYESSKKGAWLSIFAYILLTCLKLGVGWWAGSKGLVADGVNNMTDVFGSIAVLLGLHFAGKPADDDHRYGHQRAETVASIIVAAIMGLAGLDVAISATKAVFTPNLEVPHPLSIWVGLGCAVIMVGVYMNNMRIYRKTKAKALRDAAFDNLSDALTAVGAVVGIIGAHLGWRWLDPVAGVAVALVILNTAWTIGSEAALTLTDWFKPDELGEIEKKVAGVRGVARVHGLRARYVGNTVAVEVTIGVKPTLSVTEAHHVSEQVERQLIGFKEIHHVHVHMEPVLTGAEAEMPSTAPMVSGDD